MRAALAVLLLALVAACAPRAQIESPRQRMEAMTERTAPVEVTCVSSTGWGSAVRLGTLDGGSVWATAEHVVSDDDCAYSIKDTTVWIMGRDSEADVALLWRPGGTVDIGHYVSDTEYTDAYLGMDLWAVGYPVQRRTDERGLQVTRGVLVAKLSDFWRVSTSFWRGSSGGPVFDARGALVGIVSRVELDHLGNPVDDQYYIAPASKVKEMTRRLTKNFSLPELACRCGMPVPERYYAQALEIAQRAQVLRDELGTPLLVTSGYRTPEYNRKVGGAPHSLHQTASALDLRSLHHSPRELAELYEKLISDGLVPDGGLGVYDTHIHIDSGKPRRW